MNFMRNVVNRFNNREINCAVRDVANEAAIYLNEIHLEVAQIAEGAKTNAEIVEGNFAADRTKLLDDNACFIGRQDSYPSRSS